MLQARRTDRGRLNDCLIRLADGDRSAFSAVFEMTLSPVSALTRKMLIRQEDAEEAAQQA